MLVRSKQVSTVLSEIFALFLFAGITVFLILFTRPAVEIVWIRLGVDLFAMLTSSVIIFLMIYSIDLDRDRDADKLEQIDGKYSIKFNNTEDRLFDQWLSGVVGVIIIAVYVGLLAYKWL